MDSVGRIRAGDTAVVPCLWRIFVVPEPGTAPIYRYIIVLPAARNGFEAPFGFGGWIFEDGFVLERDNVVVTGALVVDKP